MFLLYPHFVVCQTWIPDKADDSEIGNIIQVSYREIEKDGHSILQFKGEMIVNTDLVSIVSIVADVDHMVDWSHNLEFAKCETISKKESFVYLRHESPGFFLSKRDAYMHVVGSQSPHNLEVILMANSDPNRGPENEDCVRISNGESKWSFLPLDVNSTKVTFQGYADPGGAISKIPNSMIKSFVLDVPYNSLSGIYDIVENRVFSGERIEWIVNYQ